MKQIMPEEKLNDLKRIKGGVRGLSLKSDGGFILKERGEDGLKELEDAMADIGYPIKYQELNEMSYYPIALKALTLVLIQKLFDFKENDFIRMGEFGSKISLMREILIKYFFSFEGVMNEIPKVWRRYYTVGELEVGEYNKEKKIIRGRLNDFNLHFLECQYLKGHFVGILSMIIKEEMTCEETKCVHRGDNYHEFVVKW